jgi:hypothetical protein
MKKSVFVLLLILSLACLTQQYMFKIPFGIKNRPMNEETRKAIQLRQRLLNEMRNHGYKWNFSKKGLLTDAEKKEIINEDLERLRSILSRDNMMK